MLSLDRILSLKYETSMARCKGCTNHCVLTINRFDGGRQFISGNRCERGLGKEKAKKEIPNLFDYKYHRMFDYEPLPADEAERGTVGIPRVLNMYENFPFWATFLKELKFRVILSPQSTRKIYELGIESIPSESECYPAKLVHGHISWLIRQGVRDYLLSRVSPTSATKLRRQATTTTARWSPLTPRTSKTMWKSSTEFDVHFMNPFFAFTNEEVLTKQLIVEFGKEYDISSVEVQKAAHAAMGGASGIPPRHGEKGRGNHRLVKGA